MGEDEPTATASMDGSGVKMPWPAVVVIAGLMGYSVPNAVMPGMGTPPSVQSERIEQVSPWGFSVVMKAGGEKSYWFKDPEEFRLMLDSGYLEDAAPVHVGTAPPL